MPQVREGTWYQATYNDKRHNPRDTAYGLSPTMAARMLFEKHPACDEVTICNAYIDDNGVKCGNGNNMHWIKRRDVMGRYQPLE